MDRTAVKLQPPGAFAPQEHIPNFVAIEHTEKVSKVFFRYDACIIWLIHMHDMYVLCCHSPFELNVKTDVYQFENNQCSEKDIGVDV